MQDVVSPPGSHKFLRPRLSPGSSSWDNPSVIPLLLAVLLPLLFGPPHLSSAGEAPLSEYLLVGQAGQEARLPCLIGRQKPCGEPYYIAWYKRNASDLKGWTRFEYRSSSGGGEDELGGESNANSRARFFWPDAAKSGGSCEQLAAASNLSPQVRLKLETLFDCAQLTLSPLELQDEGQYKCEITFSESLDSERCPATTQSQLSVIAQPNEPELLVNGRQVESGQVSGPLKEGGQARLECQSSGGRPSPRIEWLNVSRPAAASESPDGRLHLDSAEVRLLRSQWPQKRTSHLDTAAAASNSSLVALPVTSSSVTIVLSRYDLRSQFACLLVPQPTQGGAPGALQVEQLIRSPAYLASLADERAGRAMLKWTKLDVQVKPSSVRLVVREAGAGERLLMPVELPHLAAPVYSLLPNRLYAVQCLVEGSRPRSRVTWFNKTAAVSLEPQVLNASDFELPPNGAHHRLSSFERFQAQPDGTFRTIASLLLSTSVYDNFEELFCKASNEAFQNDELIQVAPIISAQLYVNYAPFAWLESLAAGEPPRRPRGPLRLAQGAELVLRCSVAANPLNQNAILQIEWLKDGRKLAPAERGQQQQAPRVHLEKANHLHMPRATSQLLAGAKLLAASQLTVSALAKSDSGAYTCHFKLIPAPQAQPHAGQQQPLGPGSQPMRITSGQANQSIHVNVIEARPKAPTLKILSSAALLVYAGRVKPSSAAPPAARRHHLLTVVAPPKAQLSLRCDLNGLPSANPQRLGAPAEQPLSHKVTWYLNGAYLHSADAGLANTFNLSLAEPSIVGALTCAHHVMGPSSSPNNFHGGLMRIYQSANTINLRQRVGPRLLTRRRELMPVVRSFSELELSAHSASKLRLTCMARCEPICSIDWHLNGRPLLFAAEAPYAGTMEPSAGDLSGASGPGDEQPSDNQTSVFGQRLRGLDKPELQPELGLIGLDQLVHLENASTRFAWLRETHLGPQHPADTLQWLRSEGRPTTLTDLQTSASLESAANVISRLELSYNQLNQLLALNEELLLKCKLIPAPSLKSRVVAGTATPTGSAPTAGGQQDASGETGFFEYARVGPFRWFPSDVETGDFASQTDAADYRYPFAGSGNEPQSNLTTLQSGAFEEAVESEGEVDVANSSELDNESHQLQSTSEQLHPTSTKRLPSSSSSSSSSAATTQTSEAAADEMQISILLDKPPKSARLLFAGVESTEEEAASVTLTESQLLELADPNKPLPLLLCHSPGKAYPAAQFRWTFTDLNHNSHAIGTDEAQLNIRQFVEFRQRQLNVDPMSAYGVDVLANIAGNYTCTVSNIHGSVSATLSLQIQGRPICKLTLGAEYLNGQEELMVNLRCSIYSRPPLLETVWFRNNQQLATNKSSLESLGASRSPLTTTEFPVMVLSKQQDFLLADLMTQTGNFKCIAHNPLGYSEACELKQTDKQVLLRTFKPLTTASQAKTPLSMLSLSGNKPPGAANSVVNYLANSSVNLDTTTHAEISLWRSIFAHLDWLLIAACSLALIWLLFVIVGSVARRHYGDKRKLRLKANQNTNWRFNGSHVTSNSQIVEPPYQSKLCANYYGDSNGDSEHDMIQSCSQSSHYEEFAQSQLQQQRMISQQPVYFNGATNHTTLNRRPLKSSVSTSSAGDNSTASLHRSRVNEVQMSATVRNFAGSQTSHYHQPKLAATMRDSLVNSDRYSAGLTLTSNVPLINGTHNSRINLDHQQQNSHRAQQQYRFNRDQQTFSSQPRNEHIYDDIIYNQIIL